MKKILIILYLASGIISLRAEGTDFQDSKRINLVAFNSSQTNESEREINRLINQGLEKNSKKIESLADNLSAEEKNYVYNDNQKDATMPFVINFLVGFGVGSFVQGDTTGGITALVGDMASIGLFVGGELMLLSSYTPAIIMMIGGITSMLGFRIFELVRPWVYTERYNKKLEESLKLAVDVQPYINIGGSLGPSYGAVLTAYF